MGKQGIRPKTAADKCPAQCRLCVHEHAQNLSLASRTDVCDIYNRPRGDVIVHRRDDCQNAHQRNNKGTCNSGKASFKYLSNVYIQGTNFSLYTNY